MKEQREAWEKDFQRTRVRSIEESPILPPIRSRLFLYTCMYGSPSVSAGAGSNERRRKQFHPPPPLPPSSPAFLWTPIITPTCGSPGTRDDEREGDRTTTYKEEQRLTKPRRGSKRMLDGRVIGWIPPFRSYPSSSCNGSRTCFERAKFLLPLTRLLEEGGDFSSTPIPPIESNRIEYS